MSQLPFITVVTVTCGRVRWLENAMQGFLEQQYDGPREHLILNTFPKQTLKVPDAISQTVRVINLPERPASLGQARNLAIAEAKGDVLITLDDDDYILPHHLSEAAKHFPAASPLQQTFVGNDWIWMEKQFWAWGDSMKDIVQGQCPCFIFTKKAWQSVGGYPAMTVGEDRLFISRVTQSLKGSPVPVNPMPSFVYGWNNGAYHTCGQGDDGPGKVPAHDRFWDELQRRVKSGVERVGEIVLEPRSRADWKHLANKFIADQLKKKSDNALCVIELGRYGDIINILPILQKIHERYATPHLMVSREFASVLDGVSYVIPHVVDFDNSQVHRALALARKEYPNVILTQVWGKDWNAEKMTETFNMESWRMGGFLTHFDDRAWPVIFDRRDYDREAAVINKLTSPNDLPIIVANVTTSHSSPFRSGPALLSHLARNLSGRFQIIDVSDLNLHRIYDLVGLIERAAVVVSIDTALLHLAAATDTPVVAIINPMPWLGTKIRFNCAARIPYGLAAAQPATVEQAILRATATPRSFGDTRTSYFVGSESKGTQTIIHATECHPCDERNWKRRAEAQKSWDAIYSKGVISCVLNEKDYPRSASRIGDRRNLPYLKDVLNVARKLTTDERDIIFFTNDDNFLHPLLPEYLAMHVSIYECCCSQRCEYRMRSIPSPDLPPKAFDEQCDTNHMGRDLFAFSARWLDEHWRDIPDFILGASDWDLCLASMIRLFHGLPANRKNLEESIFPAEIPRGYVSHQFHHPFWSKPENANDSPSQKHNRSLFRKWASTNLPGLRFDELNRI